MTTSAWASPMHHRTIWWVSALCSMRRVGSSAARRWRPWESLSSSALARASMASGSSGSGMFQGLSRSGVSLSDRVSPVSARVSLAIAQMSPAMTRVGGSQRLAERHGQGADALVLVVVLVARRASPKNDEKWPETCTVASGRTVPEKTRTRETRPT